VISGSRREIAENCALLDFYAARIGNFLQTFRDNLSVPSSGFKNPKESLQPQYGVYIGKTMCGEYVSVAMCRLLVLWQVAGRREV
jgi:hypothetical protein